MLRQIVAEKGYYAYKNRHTEILLALLKSVRTYEELSDEGKIILQAQMNLGEEQIKQLSYLLYPPSEFGDDVSPTIGTEIGRIRILLASGKRQFSPFPEEKRIDPIGEYIGFLGISLKTLMVYDDTTKVQDMPLHFKYALKDYYRESYPNASYDGFLTLFEDVATIDIPLCRTALRWEDLYAQIQTKEHGAHKTRQFRYSQSIHEYLQFQGARVSEKIEDFCKNCEYIYLTSDKLDELLSTDTVYAKFYGKIDEKTWVLIGREKLLEYRKSLKELSEQLKYSRLGNTGRVGKWKNNLKDRVSKIAHEIDRRLGNSKDEALNGKMRLYLLQKTAMAALGENFYEDQDASISRLFAAILGSTYNIVREYTTRLKGDNLSYKSYKLQAKQVESIYKLIYDLDGDKVRGKKAMIDSVVEDLIPVLPPSIDSKEARMKVFKEYTFSDRDLEAKIRRAIEES